MFCKKCGTEMSDDARFCPKCGYDTQGGTEVKQEKKVEDNEIKLTLKPKFHLGYKLITAFGKTILYVILFALIMLGDIDVEKADGGILATICGIACGVILVCILIKLIFEKIQYKYYQYNFYNTKVEYKDGFLNKEEKELKYKHIREVVLRQNIVERIFNIGTIRIFTNASSGFNNGYGYGRNMRNMNGLQIHCIQNPKEEYQKVKELIDAVSGEE